MNLFPYALAIALSCLFPVTLSPALTLIILNLMQFSVQPSLEIMPCHIASLF